METSYKDICMIYTATFGMEISFSANLNEDLRIWSLRSNSTRFRAASVKNED